MTSSFIIGGCRTPIGKFLGSLSSVPATQLGATVVRDVLRRTDSDPASIDEVILGMVLPAGTGQAPARQAALRGGLPDSIAALTINKVCGSGLKAVMLADQIIRAGDAERIIAGGMESMSQSPFLLPRVRQGWKFGHQQALDSMLHDGLWCAFEDAGMGTQADYIAASRGVSRADQDAFAAASHTRSIAAVEALRSEITPVDIAGWKGADRKGDIVVDRDEGPRPETSVEALAKLKPAFANDGTVTAGNASQISDGAAALLVVSEAVARQSRSPIKARIVATATSGVAPKEIFIAPVSAIERVLEKAKLRMADIDLVEMNEAFAAQCLACMRPLDLPHEKVNVLGGAIALGHPIGASGARVLVTLLHALAARGLRRGLVALCLGGGNAVAMVVEREEA